MDYQGRASIAVSPSPKPRIDVFALPEKFDMAVTESDLDLQGLKNVRNFLMTVQPVG